MPLLLRLTEHAARLSTWMGGAALLFMSLIVAIDVIGRKFFGFTFGGADEISGYVFAISTSWALSFTLLHRGHIRIDVIYNNLSQRMRNLLDLLSLLSMAVVGGMIAWYGYGVAEKSFLLAARSNTPLGIPLWIPQSLWFAGLLLFLWTLLLLLAASLTAFARSEGAEITRMAGIPSTTEDAQAAVEEAEALTTENR